MADEYEIKATGRDIVVKVPYKEGRVYFSFSEISRSHQSFTASLVVIVESTKEGVLDEYQQRLDLKSHSAIEGFRRSLQNAYKGVDVNWVLVINRALNEVIRYFNKSQQPVNFKGAPVEATTFLLHPFLQKDANNMVFGDSEVGKSYFCLRLAASLATGVGFMGFSPEEGGKKTLFLDYEDSSSVFNKRLHEIASGLGVDVATIQDSIYWFKPDGSIRDLSEVIARMVADYAFDLIVIDAGSNAAGGSPNDEQKVVDMFNALENIPCTKLIIHHEPKDSDGKSDEKAYYGTVFWRALTRVAWRLTLENEENGKLIKASIAKKSNMGRVEPFVYRQIWDIGELGAHFGPVTLTREEQHSPTGESKVIEALTTAHGKGSVGLSRSQLTEITGIGAHYFKELIQRMKDDGKVEISGEKRGALWRLKEAYPPKTPPQNLPPQNTPPKDEETEF